MFSKVDYVMVRVSDMRRSVAFYRDTLGLPLKFESPGWSEFETGATTLALHASAPSAAGSEAAHQAAPAAGTCALGFSVRSRSPLQYPVILLSFAAHASTPADG